MALQKFNKSSKNERDYTKEEVKPHSVIYKTRGLHTAGEQVFSIKCKNVDVAEESARNCLHPSTEIIRVVPGIAVVKDGKFIPTPKNKFTFNERNNSGK